MTTHDIELPPLPPGLPTYVFPEGAYTPEQMQDYATAAIEADRKKQGEIVVTKTPEGEIVAVTRQDDEGRILSVIAEAESKRRGEPVAWRLAKEGKIGLTSYDQEQVDTYVSLGWRVCQELYAAPQPAEPVKVPSDADIDGVWRELTGRPCIPGSTAHAFARALLARYGQPADPTHKSISQNQLKG